MRFVQGVVIAAFALIGGFVLGGLQPRLDATRWREAAEEAPRSCPEDDRAALRMADVFRGRPLDGDLPAADVPEPEGEEEPAPGAVPAGSPRGRAVGGGGEELDLDGAVDAAKVAMRLRRAQARAALEEAGATEVQLAAIDAAMEKMNAELGALADEFAAVDEPPDRRDMMVFAADALEAVVAADDALYGAFDEETRASLDDAALDPMSYLDEHVVESLIRANVRRE